MQARWLQRNDANDVLVCFGGWAIGAEPLQPLKTDTDVLFVDDYRDLVALPDLSGYTTRTVVAYSFGVAAFAHWLQANEDPFDRKIAINGSPTPIDRRLGIHPKIFARTCEHLSHETFQDFVALCYGEPQPEQLIDIAARHAELLAVAARGPAPSPDFDRIWISSEDRIFPAANLNAVFRPQAARIQQIDASHVPFEHWQSWDEVTG
ncbi:pimeloyl-ACP methyl esterase BioG family protein [Cognatishimia maritima]|uniref:Biotin synthesis protein BioG n=1 Tax=Cognatishimia maritima TaxID=870908 RepID=A0A1M5MYU7_9RHOB|nr:pimeloyl-ACP methyl esterase BioG family protein [Cognatishimia maritima]SHG82451.1 biotin synthesis protein BioG [Cognatishimia maritima]